MWGLRFRLYFARLKFQKNDNNNNNKYISYRKHPITGNNVLRARYIQLDYKLISHNNDQLFKDNSRYSTASRIAFKESK
jgi:uncharacterized membrane-anchored protein